MLNILSDIFWETGIIDYDHATDEALRTKYIFRAQIKRMVMIRQIL